MKRTFVASLLTISIATSSFATGCVGMTPEQQRALSGGAIGAAGGAALGAVTGGSAGVGAAVGGAAGAATGWLFEKNRQRNRR